MNEELAENGAEVVHYGVHVWRKQRQCNMILHTIEVLNYKCLRHIRQELQPFQILVGPNASGKSTFLDVVVFLQDILRNGLQKAVQKRARSIRELVWQMGVEPIEIAVELQIPEHLHSREKEDSRIRYELRIGTDNAGTLTFLVENLWLVRKHAQTARVLHDRPEIVFPKERQPPTSIVKEPRRRVPPGYRKVMSRTADGRMYVRSETSEWNFPLNAGKDRAGLILIPEEQRFPVSIWLRNMLTEQLHFVTLNSQVMRWPCPPEAPKTFQPDGSNLALVVEQLQNHPVRLHQWVNHVRTVLPAISMISIREREEDRSRYLVVETEEGRQLPSWLLSDGTLRLLAMTVLAYLPEEMGIYIIEEPENGVHPRALEAVYQSLSSVYEGQVFCATHSPIFLNLATPNELLCFTLNERGATDIVPGNRHPYLKEWRSEVSLGNLLASGILG
jgi:predicted ATPase